MRNLASVLVIVALATTGCLGARPAAEAGPLPPARGAESAVALHACEGMSAILLLPRGTIDAWLPPELPPDRSLSGGQFDAVFVGALACESAEPGGGAATVAWWHTPVAPEDDARREDAIHVAVLGMLGEGAAVAGHRAWGAAAARDGDVAWAVADAAPDLRRGTLRVRAPDLSLDVEHDVVGRAEEFDENATRWRAFLVGRDASGDPVVDARADWDEGPGTLVARPDSRSLPTARVTVTGRGEAWPLPGILEGTGGHFVGVEMRMRPVEGGP